MEGFALISESVINEIKYRTDTEQLIGDYVQLKRKGTTLVGLCPFHSEKTPSFTVWPQKGSYYCFGCGAGGDSITFVRQIENLEYVEALHFLAKRAGIIIPEESTSESEREANRLRMRILELNREAAKHFHEQLFLPAGEGALRYLKERRFSDKTIKKFGIGYAGSGSVFVKKMRDAGYSDSEMQTAFLVSFKYKNPFLMFSDRIIFPMIDPSGGVVGFAGRIMPGANSDRKYFNTNDTPVFNKRRFLFGLNLARKTKQDHIIITEGPTDAICLHQAGFDNAVASQGTALTEEHARLLARYTSNVVLCFDGDTAGSRATQRVCEILRSSGLSVKVVALENAKDPDEYIRKFGKERFSALLQGSADSVSFRIHMIKTGYDLDKPDEKVACLKAISEYLSTLDNELEIDVYCDKVAKELNIDLSSFKSETRRALKKRAGAARKRAASGRGEVRRPGESPAPPRDDYHTRLCMGIVRYALENPGDCERLTAMLPGGSTGSPLWDGVLARIQRSVPGTAADLTPLGSELSVADMALLTKMQISKPCADMKEAGRYVDMLKIHLQEQSLTDPNGEIDLAGYFEDLKKQKH